MVGRETSRTGCVENVRVKAAGQHDIDAGGSADVRLTLAADTVASLAGDSKSRSGRRGLECRKLIEQLGLACNQRSQMIDKTPDVGELGNGVLLARRSGLDHLQRHCGGAGREL